MRNIGLSGHVVWIYIGFVTIIIIIIRQVKL